MSRGENAPMGSERTSQNGYAYVKTPDGWRLKHHIIAERKYGRSVDTKIERVIFADHNRKNFDPANIVIEKKKGVTKEAQKARLQSRIDELQGQLETLEEEAS